MDLKIAIQTQSLLKHLSKASPGLRINYITLASIAGCEVKPGTKGYAYLYRARRILEREGIFFSAVRADSEFHGIQRLTNEEAIGLGIHGRNAIRRRARLEANRLHANPGYDDLPQDKKNEWNANMTFFRAIDHFAKPSNIKRIEDVCAKNGEAIKIGDTLKMFQE